MEQITFDDMTAAPEQPPKKKRTKKQQPKLVQNVVKHGFRFQLYYKDEPKPIFVVERAESEEAARMNLPQNADGTRDWRFVEIADIF